MEPQTPTKSHIPELPRLLWKPFLIIWMIGAVVLFAGYLAGLKSDIPGYSVDPVTDIVHLAGMSNSDVVMSVFGGNFLWGFGLLVTSPVHLGLGLLIYFGHGLFSFGSTLAWYGKLPGETVANGLSEQLILVIPEYLATSLLATISIWICWVVVRPPPEMSLPKAIIMRFLKSAPVMPIVVILFAAAAVIQESYSLPRAYGSIQSALVNENLVTRDDLAKVYTIEIPVSWTESSETHGGMGWVKSFSSNNAPLRVDVRLVLQEGLPAWTDIEKIFEITVKQVLEQQGRRQVGSPENLSLSGLPAIRIMATGINPKDPFPGNPETVEVFYLVSKPDPVTGSTTSVGIFFQVDKEWYDLSLPQMERIVESFRFQNS